MKRNDVICDCCGSIINDKYDPISGISIQRYGIFGIIRHPDIDICDNCFNKIKEIIKEGKEK